MQARPRRHGTDASEGRALYEFIAPFFDGLPRLVERMKGAAVEPLMLAADQFLTMEALPAVLTTLRETHPDFRIRIDERSGEGILRSVVQGECDAGLVHLADTPRGVNWEPLGRIGVALLIPTRHPLAKLGRAPTSAEPSRNTP